MTTDPITFKRGNIDRARQHQHMQAHFGAYRDFLAWLDDKIKSIDEAWYKVDDETARASQFRGQRLALEDVRSQLLGSLNMDIAAEITKLETMIGGGQT